MFRIDLDRIRGLKYKMASWRENQMSISDT